MKLSEISTVITKGTTPRGAVKYDEGNVNFLRAENVDGVVTLSNPPKMITEEIHSGPLKRSILKKDDLLITIAGTLARTAFVTEELLPANTNQAVALIRLKDEIVNKKYVYYYLRQKEIIETLKASSAQSVQPNLNLRQIGDIDVVFPPREIQDKAVEILECIDEKIRINDKVNNNLEQQADAIFTREFLAFTDSIPVGWKESNLLEIADYLNGLAMQKYRPKYDEVGIPVLKIKELRQGNCDASSELCSPNIKPEYLVHDGDVIFSWSGSLLVDFWCGGTCGLNQHLFKVTSNQYDKWFYYVWTKYHLSKFISIAADMATTMGHIKRDELAKSEVLIPNKDEYRRIGSLLQPIYELMINNRLENAKLSKLRDELLPKLMSGELDVSELDI